MLWPLEWVRVHCTDVDWWNFGRSVCACLICYLVVIFHGLSFLPSASNVPLHDRLSCPPHGAEFGTARSTVEALYPLPCVVQSRLVSSRRVSWRVGELFRGSIAPCACGSWQLCATPQFCALLPSCLFLGIFRSSAENGRILIILYF